MPDLSDIQNYIPPLAQALGIDPATALLLVGVIVAISNLVGRLIPDDKTGILGAIRGVAKFIGLYASNRVSSGLSVNEIARTTLPIVEHLGTELEKVEERLEVVKAFPGLPDRDPVSGKFKKKE